MQSLKFSVEQRQSQTLSPRLQHAVRLLQMSSLDFKSELQNLLVKNPFLEVEEEADGMTGPPSEPAADLPESLPTSGPELGVGDAEAAAEPPTGLQDSAGVEEGPDDYTDTWLADGSMGKRQSEGGDVAATDITAAHTSLAAHLHGQVDLLNLSPKDRLWVKALVESLDDDGYLRTPLEELAILFAPETDVQVSDLHIALRLLQSCEPVGVGARTVQECLLLQLAAKAPSAERDLAQRIVEQHLGALAGKDIIGLAKKLGRSVAEIQAACDCVRRLDPHPGWRFMSARVDYIVPDLIVRRVRGKWTVELNGSILPKVRLNHVYAELFQRHRRTEDGEMATHLQEARWTLRNVEQRFATILDVAQAIVKRQHQFFDHGVLAMKPLGLKEIAAETGLHESTVSRVTNNKYMATPAGVFELKYFFSRTMTTASGGACSATAIRGLLKEMIDAEAPAKPLSDAEIARRLARQGLIVARRTITKYRQSMRIEAVERRRQVA